MGRMEKVALTCIHCHVQKGSWWEDAGQQRELSSVLGDDLEWWDGVQGGSRGRGYMHNYG